jgi:hypothetical protein
VLRLTLLAPDIVERILEGRPTAGLAQFLKPFPVSGSSSATSSAKLKLRRRTARFVAATSMQAAGRHSCSLTCLLIGLTYLVCISKNLAIREISQ